MLQFYINTNMTIAASATVFNRQDIFIMNTLSGTGSTDMQLPLRRARIASIIYSSAYAITAPAAVSGAFATLFESVAVDELGSGAIPVRTGFDHSLNSISTAIWDNLAPTKTFYRDMKLLPCGDTNEANNMPRFVNNGTRKIKVRKSLNDQQCISCYFTVKNAAAAQIQLAWSINGIIYYKLTF